MYDGAVFFNASTESMTMSDFGIKIGHGGHKH